MGKHANYSDPVYMEACTTERQKEILEAVNITATLDDAATWLNMPARSLHRALARIRTQAAKTNPDLHNGTNIPEGYAIKGSSSLIDEEGNTKLKWVKTDRDILKQQEMMTLAAEEFAHQLPQLSASEHYPSDDTNTNIIPWFNIGDAHLGMVAYAMEVGHNFDLGIAERELCEAMKMLIDRAAGYERCVIQDMGDFTHYENMAGVTDHSGHALDCDTRFQKMIRIYTRTMRFIVDYALQKFKYVDVIINQGNHSRTNDFWMAHFLRHVYEKEKRVHVLNNDSVFIGYRMGNTFVMCHHTDKCKANKLIDVMATDFRTHFGECKYKYVDGGHVHHKSVAKEYGDVIIETFNQLAPADKYAHDGGWRSRSFLTCVLRSKEYGEVGRHIVTAEEVQDKLSLKGHATSKGDKGVYEV